MSKPIGVFDSGLGGLTAFKQLSKLLPHEDIFYFGDTGRVPYGNRSSDIIKKYAAQDINFLESLGIKMIVVACGTISSVISDIKNQVHVPFVGVIEPTAMAAFNATKTKRVGVIGTRATIKSSAYEKKLHELDPQIQVFQKACDLFVPLVENGFALQENKIVDLTIQHYLEDIRSKEVDTLILGCTHYPILRHAIKKFMGDKVKLIDSGCEAAIVATKILRESNLECREEKNPEYKFFVSDNTDNFSNTAKIFLDRDILDEVIEVDIEKY